MLPIEIYHIILQYLEPDDLHKFAESSPWCRYIVNRMNRNKYHSRHSSKKRFIHITYSLKSLDNELTFLQKIHKEPKHAYYRITNIMYDVNTKNNMQNIAILYTYWYYYITINSSNDNINIDNDINKISVNDVKYIKNKG